MIRYSLWNMLYLSVCLLITCMFHRPARLIRLPVDIRGEKYIIWGRGFTSGRNCRFEAMPMTNNAQATIIFGNNVQVNDNVHIVGSESVRIGNDVLIASKVFISDCSHGIYSGVACSSPDCPPQKRPIFSRPVEIMDRVWIGDNVVIMPGVTIGEGSIVGASAVVSQSIPDECLAVGIPARVIKKYDRLTNQWINI